MSKKRSEKRGRNLGGAKARVVTGTLDVTRSGMGFVVVPGESNDVLVRPSDFRVK
jgi:ribonuclease R